MKELLKKLGFIHVTGNLYKHLKTHTFINVDENLHPVDLPEKLIEVGRHLQNEMIKSLLDIKP